MPLPTVVISREIITQREQDRRAVYPRDYIISSFLDYSGFGSNCNLQIDADLGKLTDKKDIRVAGLVTIGEGTDISVRSLTVGESINAQGSIHARMRISAKQGICVKGRLSSDERQQNAPTIKAYGTIEVGQNLISMGGILSQHGNINVEQNIYARGDIVGNRNIIADDKIFCESSILSQSYIVARQGIKALKFISAGSRLSASNTVQAGFSIHAPEIDVDGEIFAGLDDSCFWTPDGDAIRLHQNIYGRVTRGDVRKGQVMGYRSLLDADLDRPVKSLAMNL